jgi:UDP-glucose:glycoprotein glucosyltransferase
MFDTLKEQNPSLQTQLDEFRKHLVESQLELAPLKAWQMQDLSFQAAQKIIDASNGEEALRLLEDLAQNFPLRARSLSKISVRGDLKKAFKSQRQVSYISNNILKKAAIKN